MDCDDLRCRMWKQNGSGFAYRAGLTLAASAERVSGEGDAREASATSESESFFAARTMNARYRPFSARVRDFPASAFATGDPMGEDVASDAIIFRKSTRWCAKKRMEGDRRHVLGRRRYGSTRQTSVSRVPERFAKAEDLKKPFDERRN